MVCSNALAKKRQEGRTNAAWREALLAPIVLPQLSQFLVRRRADRKKLDRSFLTTKFTKSTKTEITFQ